jgi:hypothetical protein
MLGAAGMFGAVSLLAVMPEWLTAPAADMQVIVAAMAFRVERWITHAWLLYGLGSRQ